MDKLQTPPIRTPLAEGNGQSAGSNGARANTAKEWYLYWQQAGELANDHTDSIAELDTALAVLEATVNASLQYGTHAGRPAANTVPRDALYIETDRDNVIYQARDVAGTPAWVYVAGVMWDTISPDNRPLGLGANDVNFAYRATDTTAAYRWSGSAWVDITPATPVTGAANLTHPNVVTKVSASGQITEGGITDQSAANSDRLHITAAGLVGIGTAGPTTALTVQAGASGAFTPMVTLNVNLAGTAGEGASLDWADASSHTIFARIRSLCRTAGQYDLAFSTYFGAALESLRLTASGGVMLPALPSSNPGAGSKQLWYDPADGNRVKYAP
jgi:hypothetical protein